MKVKTTKRLIKKFLNRELQNEQSNIKLFDDDLKKSLQDDIKLISLFIRKRQLKNWINIYTLGDKCIITYKRKYKFINDVDTFKYIIGYKIDKAIKYHYNGF